LKARILGLVAIQKSRGKQRSRLTWLRIGDVNTKNFHIMANARRKKNCIHSLQHKSGIVVSQEDKYEVVYDHFSQCIGSCPRNCSLNFDNLGWQPRALHHLDQPVTEDDLKIVIMGALKEKAPSTNGFIGMLFSLCWTVIKEDLLLAIDHFLSRNHQGLHLLNQAYVILIPKKSCPKKITGYRLKTNQSHT
jgi:hypothetical protein